VRSSSREYNAFKANQLEKRLISFAASIVALSSRLAETVQGRHICRQIVRSGTALIVFKELNETTIWLELITESSLLSPENTAAIVAEKRELCRIIAASIKTARMASE